MNDFVQRSLRVPVTSNPGVGVTRNRCLTHYTAPNDYLTILGFHPLVYSEGLMRTEGITPVPNLSFIFSYIYVYSLAKTLILILNPKLKPKK